MNTRKIKLALTVGLLNNDTPHNVLSYIRDLMLGFQEVGSFLGQSLTGRSILNPSHVKQTYAMKFEHCTVNVDVVSNPQTNSQTIHGFQLG